MNPLQPPLTLLVKLGSITIHTAEMLSPSGHHFDRITIQQLLIDPEVNEWIKEMNKMALLPIKRQNDTTTKLD